MMRNGMFGAQTRRAFFRCLHNPLSEEHRDELSKLRPDDWTDVVRAAKQQRVAALLQARVQRSGIRAYLPASIQHELHQAAVSTARRMLLLHAELDAALDRLSAKGIPVVVLKGAHAATAFYGNVALRDMVDLDLLVPDDRLAEAVAALRTIGFEPEGPLNIRAARRISQHPAVLTKAGRASIELHWNITDPRSDCAINPLELWARAVPLARGAPAQALCTEDFLVHACHHGSYHHLFGFGIRPLCDIAAVIDSRTPIDWTLVVYRAKTWRWERGVSLTLYLVRTRLGRSVPDEVLRALGSEHIDATLDDAAERHLLVAPREIKRLGNVAPLAVRQRLMSRLRYLAAQVFLEPAELAFLYERPTMPAGSRIWWTIVRAKDLVKRHAWDVLALARPGTATADIAAAQNVLRRWLAGT